MDNEKRYLLRKDIVRKHLKDWNIRFDQTVADTIEALLCYGFSPCIVYGNPRKKKLLFPRIEIKLIHSVIFHYSEKRMETVIADQTENRKRLLGLISQYNDISVDTLALVDCSTRKTNHTDSVIVCSKQIKEAYDNKLLREGVYYTENTDIMNVFAAFLLKKLKT